jgi:hypothetical protein
MKRIIFSIVEIIITQETRKPYLLSVEVVYLFQAFASQANVVEGIPPGIVVQKGWERYLRIISL